MIQTAWPWGERTAARGRPATPLAPTVAPDLHREIAPVWELAPRRHGDRVGQRSSVVQRDGRLRRGLASVDVVSTCMSLILVLTFVDPGRVGFHLGTLLIFPLVLLTGKLVGLYDRDPHVLRKTTIDEAPSILYLSVVFALGAWLCEAVLFNGYLARPQVFGLLLAMFALTSLGRLIVRRLAFALTSPERCVVIGDGADAGRIAAKLAATPSVNASVIGRVDLHAGPVTDDHGPVKALGGYAALGRVVAEHHVERAIIAPHSDGQEEILDAIRLIKALGVKVSVLPRLLEVVGSTSTFDDIDGMTLLGVRQYGLARSSELIKRTTDIAVASALLALLSPALLILTAAIKLDSPGPVLFRQRRIGRHGDCFWMLKLRSMVVDAEARKAELQERNEVSGGMFKITDDPRITAVGRILRRTSLDELPQLLNVLRGEMSLVGPRPLVEDEDLLVTGWQRRRLSVKPGMTGLWQIFGSSRIPMQEMVKIDYIYGANWSLWLDLRILLRTVPYMLTRRGQ